MKTTRSTSRLSALFFVLCAVVCGQVVFYSCATSNGNSAPTRLPDTLRVGTLYSPANFFIYRGDTMGYDYDRIRDFAADKKIQLQFTVAHNINELLKMVQERKVDILACDVPVDAEHNEQVLHCGETRTSYQVLVQKGHRIRNVIQLRGKEVHVVKGSKYALRLEELNDELGGGITIVEEESDTISAQGLIAQVSAGKIAFTIIDSDIAKINKSYYPQLDISLEVSFPQRSSWAVNLNDNMLSDSIDAWSTSERTVLYSEDASKHYFDRNSSLMQGSFYDYDGRYVRHSGDISQFDSLFKAYAGACPYRWEMLAAIAHTESNFNPNVVSWAGARGLMQIMPSTARGYGFDVSTLHDPEVSVKACVRELNELDRYFTRYVANSSERTRFVLAAYNGGMAHIIDAINLAKKYGLNPAVWYGNVEEALKWKSIEKYYNDPVCRYGYFRYTETVNYVQKVERTYNAYRH